MSPLDFVSMHIFPFRSSLRVLTPLRSIVTDGGDFNRKVRLVSPLPFLRLLSPLLTRYIAFDYAA